MSLEPILTPRLRLRPLEPRDAPALSAYRSDPNVARYQSWKVPFSKADALELIQAMRTRDITDLGWTQIGITTLETDELIGDIGFNRVDSSTAEIGFTLAAAQQRQGLMREAVHALLESASATGVQRITATTDIRNTASQRLLTHLGFALERITKDTWLEHGEFFDECQYALEMAR